MKNLRYVLLCFLLLVGVLLASCSGAIVKPTSTFSPSWTPSWNSWLDPTSAVSPVSFSVEMINMECVRSYKAIPIKFIFHNITNEKVRLDNEFSLVPDLREVIAIIIDEKGNEFWDADLFTRADAFPTAPTPAYQEISPGASFVLLTEYFFPTVLLSALGAKPGAWPTAVSPKAGKYFVKFQYQSIDVYDDDHIWEGVVESNQIEICIK